MGTDPFSTVQDSIIAPVNHAAAITPHDTNELTNYAKAIYVGGAGDLKLTTPGGSTVTLVGCLAGTIYPIRAKIVFSTGTTATNLVALY